MRVVVVACLLVAVAACGDSSQPATPAAEPTSPTTVAVAVATTVDGCSSDNSPTNVVVTSGDAPAIAVSPESADSPLPDLVVRRINCAGGWMNLRNEVPADKPVLVWFWAPY